MPYKHNFSNEYLKGSKVFNFPVVANSLILGDSYFDFFGFNIGYGVTEKFTIEADGGYFGNKTQNFSNGAWIVGNGISDIGLTLKYNFYHSNDSVWNMTISPETKFPTGAL